MKRRVAVLADDTLQRHLLQQALCNQGHEVVLNACPLKLLEQGMSRAESCQPDVWLVNLLDQQADSSELLEYLFGLSVPVLIGEEKAPERSSADFVHWQRSLAEKVSNISWQNSSASHGQQLSGQVLQNRENNTGQIERLPLPEALCSESVPGAGGKVAEQLWLLAASLGGPDAVKEFLDVLPAGLPVGFLYAQHIDAGFEQSLPRVVGRHSQWSVRNATDNDQVLEGEVVVVSIAAAMEFSATGGIRLLQHSWSGPYSPSIEQLMRSLSARYRQNCGIMIFSGMGEDGSLACEFVSQQGTPIWTQSEQSCACPVMPASIRKTGFSGYSSSPRGLAMALINHLLRAQKLKSMESF